MNVINGILTDFCHATVIGYEKRSDKYWCKIYNEHNCSLHIELEIMYKDDESSLVKLTPMIEKFCVKF